MRVMFLAAHPDDAEFACGGTIARHAEAGDTIHVVVCTDGVSSRIATVPTLDEAEAADRRSEEAAAALHILAPHAGLEFLGFEDQRLGEAPLDLARRVTEEVRRFHPDRLYLQGGDGNDDHVAVERAGIVASRPQPGVPHPRQVLRFVIPEWRAWGAEFRPNFYVRLSEEHKSRKLAAAQCYTEELRGLGHPRSALSMEDLMRWDGAGCGYGWAEAYEARWVE